METVSQFMLDCSSKSVEVIFPCRQLPATPYTQVRFRFFDLNCCHLHFFDVKLAILFRH